MPLFAQLPEFRMAYEVVGKGIPLLFLHGFPLNHTMWQPQIEALADIGRVIAPDLRGHGLSEAPKGIYTMETMAQDCRLLIDSIGIKDKIVIAGLSMGGYIAFAFYRLYPRRVKGMILAATRAVSDSPEARLKREETASQIQTLGVRQLQFSMAPKLLAPESYDNKPGLGRQVESMIASISIDGAVGALLGMKERPDSTSILREIKVPTLILHGNDDQLIPPSEAQTMHSLIQGSQFHLLSEAGHLPNLEQSSIFNQLVRAFILAF